VDKYSGKIGMEFDEFNTFDTFEREKYAEQIEELISQKNILEEGIGGRFWKLIDELCEKEVKRRVELLLAPMRQGTGVKKDNDYTMYERGVIKGIRLVMGMPASVIELVKTMRPKLKSNEKE